MFTRTISGLQNEHLFYGVDLVVYCEGRAVDGEGSSLDEVFWEKVFSQNGKSVECKSAGSKTELRPFARRVVDENISNVVVAMDRDYDDFRNQMIDHPQVIYTFGYSWESDVILDFQFDIALSLFATMTRKKPIRDEFTAFRTKQSSLLRRVFALDLKYIGSDQALFDRNKPVSILAIATNAEPYVNVSNLLTKAKQIGRYQTATLPAATYKSACGIRSFFGKTVSHLVFHWFSYRTRSINGSRKAVYSTFMTSLINTLNLIDVGVPRNTYYSAKVARI